MKDSVSASRCSRCGARIYEGELVGVEKGEVLCCMCLDPRTAKLEIVRRGEDDSGSEDREVCRWRINEGPLRRTNTIQRIVR